MYMNIMHVVDDVDLDLLRAFVRLFELGSVTRAASALGLSQPAMSHALSRLRRAFGDPLFVRTPRGMLPTPRAQALSGEVAQIVRDVDGLLRPPGELVPGTLARIFTLATADYGESVLVPGLIRALTRIAPGVDLAVVPFPDQIDLALERGTVDVALDVSGRLPNAMGQKLFSDRLVTVVRRGNKGVGRRLSLERYIELPHVLIAPRGRPGGTVDSALAELGLVRRVKVRVASFLAALTLVAESDLILTAPERVVTKLARHLPLVVLEPPLELPTFSIWQVWHPRMHRDPAHAFFREQLARAAADG
jgi:DNA-binding transcriptional LysR family regulator